MDKKEFLDVLRQFLNGEVSVDVIEQNIRYYDHYISSQSSEEEARVIEMLGDPRLIAKTVIETEKAAKHKDRNHSTYENDSYSGYDTDREESGYRHKQERQGKNIFITNLTWRQKLTAILILIAVIIVLIVIGRIIIGFLFAFAVPILLVLLLFAMFRKRD